MIARAALFFLIFAFVFFGLYWTVFRTNYFTAERVLKIVKTFGIVVISIASAFIVMIAMTIIDKLI